MRDWSFITMKWGHHFAVGGGGHFQNLDWFWGTFSEVREHYPGGHFNRFHESSTKQ